MSWREGLILWLLFGGIAMAVWGAIADQFAKPDEWDSVAERKRRIERQAKIQSGEFR